MVLAERTLKGAGGDHSPHAEDKTNEFLFIQGYISRCRKRPQVNIAKKKIKPLLTKSAFNENHLRKKKRHETTTENQPPGAEFLPQSTSSSTNHWIPLESKSLLLKQQSWRRCQESADSLARCTELNEALRDEKRSVLGFPSRRDFGFCHLEVATPPPIL